MAAGSTKVPVRFIVFILFFYVSLQPCSSQSDVKVSVREIIRHRRQVCVDGTYEHEGRTCCLCAAGQYLKKDCSSSRDDRICDQCESGTYNSYPNSFKSCRPCTSCSHPNANLVVAEPCTIARDAKCRCKEGHYCTSNTGSCQICHPCTVCSTSIKEPCTATNNTVCNEPEGTNTTAIVVPVIVVGLIVAAVAAVLLWRKKRAAQQPQAPSDTTANGNPTLPLYGGGTDIQPLLPLIAEQLEWKDVERLAMRGGLSDPAIQSCKLDHPGDSQEQTLQLLRKWVESQGKRAANSLVENLRESRQITKAEKVEEILYNRNPTG